jgi:cytochrome P450
MTRVVMAPIPLHVPQDLVRDVDTFNLPGSQDDQFLAMKRLQEESPDIFWTPHNGGHWVMTRGADLYPLFANVEMFSNKHIAIPRTTGAIPLLPIESDGATHAVYRKLIQPWFGPKKVKTMSEEVARPLAIRLIEGFKPNAECEFVEDFAKQMPIIVFLEMMGLPHEDAPYLLPLVEVSVRSNDAKLREECNNKMGEYIRAHVEQKRAKPGDDLMSAVVHARFEDRPATMEEIYGFCFNLLYGGLDTVASCLSFVAHFLAESPQHRQQLIDNPNLIPKATEELLRRFGVGNPGKMIAKDCLYKGIQFKEGDMVLFAGGFHGIDDRAFENPLAVNFNRDTTPITATFGNGPHRCPGSFLARSELKIFLEEWLGRIPNFRVTPGKKPISSGGGVSGMIYLPFSWDV